MRYWWVNQNETYKHEVRGGYLWSPKRKTNGHRNPFYDFMREVSPGDVIFSFADTWIRTIGIARSNAYEAPKPLEFGLAGANWDKIGWRVDVQFYSLERPFKPADHMDVLRSLLPDHYSPLRSNGFGLQNIYLTLLAPPFAEALFELAGSAMRDVAMGQLLNGDVPSPPAAGLAQWEEHQLQEVMVAPGLSETVREAVVLARRGQGIFKRRVMEIELACRITGVTQPQHLRASHCKPWRDSNNDERLDAENGLLLTPSIDHLFDRGFIGFEDNGNLLVSPVADEDALRRMGVASTKQNVGSFSSGQKAYLAFHRENVFLQSSFLTK